MNIGQKIYALRMQKGITQLELAKIAGVSDKTVSAWEAMTRTPKVGAIRKVCNNFGLELETFIDESTDSFGKKEEQPTVSDGLAEAQQSLIAYAKTLTEEQAVLALRVLKSVVGDDQ